MLMYRNGRMKQIDRRYLFGKNISTTIDIVSFAYIGINRSLFTNEQMYDFIYFCLVDGFFSSLFKYIYMCVSLTDVWPVYMCIYCLRDKASDHME